MIKYGWLTVLLFLIGSGGAIYGQQKKDTTQLQQLKDSLVGKIMSTIRIDPKDTLFTKKAEEIFLPHSGKIIRKIWIHHLGFEKTFYSRSDTTGFIVKLANAVHSNTREQIIRDHLFLKEGEPLNPYKAADNERYLRDLEFILDVRIDVIALGTSDSIDLRIVTRDVFSWGVKYRPRDPGSHLMSIYDANLMGCGQRLELVGLIDQDRSPHMGYEVFYRKSSAFGSLANISTGYTSINSASSYGTENENAFFVKLERPLVSPYIRWAGGAEFSMNTSSNVFQKPDSLFLPYQYLIYDLWMGYNMGIKRQVQNRTRHFIALRWFSQQYRNVPYQFTSVPNPLYYDNYYVLGEFTFFRQDFYKTRYVLGFGRTEDIPYGHKALFTLGVSRQLDVRRLYMGAEFNKRVVTGNGGFYDFDVRASTFVHRNPEDGALLLSLTRYSKLIKWGNKIIRYHFNIDYATIFNHKMAPLLTLNQEFGIRGFKSDSLFSKQRLGLSIDAILFTKWKLLGFNIAPLTFTDISFFPPEHEKLFYDKPYLGLGVGLRIRNENLIFNTVEIRFIGYPRVVNGGSPFRIKLVADLNAKLTGRFAKSPAFLQFN